MKSAYPHSLENHNGPRRREAEGEVMTDEDQTTPPPAPPQPEDDRADAHDNLMPAGGSIGE